MSNLIIGPPVGHPNPITLTGFLVWIIIYTIVGIIIYYKKRKNE